MPDQKDGQHVQGMHASRDPLTWAVLLLVDAENLEADSPGCDWIFHFGAPNPTPKRLNACPTDSRGDSNGPYLFPKATQTIGTIVMVSSKATEKPISVLRIAFSVHHCHRILCVVQLHSNSIRAA